MVDLMTSWKRGRVSQVVFQVKSMYQTSHLMYGILSTILFLMMSQLAKCMTLSNYPGSVSTLSLKQNHNPVRNPLPLSLNTDPVATDHSVAITDCPVISEVHFCLSEIVQGDVIVIDYVNTLNDNPYDSTDPEITFGPHTDAEFDADDTLIYQAETPDRSHQTKIITIQHAICFNDMIEAFSDPETLTRPLAVRRLLPDNSEEAGSGSGVLRDVYSAFWQVFYDRCTLGTTMKVPFIGHDFKADTWRAINRIFMRGYQDFHYLPIKLAPHFVE